MKPGDEPLDEHEAERLMDELRAAVGAPPDELVELVRLRLDPGYDELARGPGRDVPGQAGRPCLIRRPDCLRRRP